MLCWHTGYILANAGRYFTPPHVWANAPMPPLAPLTSSHCRKSLDLLLMRALYILLTLKIPYGCAVRSLQIKGPLLAWKGVNDVRARSDCA
jgi:hypothetical protein